MQYNTYITKYSDVGLELKNYLKLERDQDHSLAPKTLSFGEKIAKIGPADPEIIVLWEIINKKKKEITEGKIYSSVGNLAKRAK